MTIEGRRNPVVLAMLLLEPGRVVTVPRLITALYDEEPPKTAETQLQICISQLRRRLAEFSDTETILTHSAGYRIQVPEEGHDLMLFRRHVARARDTVRAHDPELAVSELRAGLALWRGEAAAGISSRSVEAVAVRLNEERYTALQECIDLELSLHRHHEVLGELRELAATHPLREKLHAQLALALYRADRQVEALDALRKVQRELVEEHGLTPGVELSQLERAILQRDPALDLPSSHLAKVVPQQLPAADPDFVDRVALMQAVLHHLTSAEHVHRAPVVVVNGPGGVGKTALAVQAAHKARERFPDGQLYARLRGTDTRPIPAEQVLEGFLRALGVAPSALLPQLAELSATYRSVLAGRHLLVVLDDAFSAQQVFPLVPAEPRCALLVTSRRALAGLQGAVQLDVEVFDSDASLALLSQTIGEARIQAERKAAHELAEACGHLPLGLRIAAAKLAVRQHWRIGQMVRRLADERQRLDELTLDQTSVRATISLSYRELDTRAARLLLLLSLLGNIDVAGWVAGPLLDVDPQVATDVLETLVEARLVDVHVATDRQVRYRLHRLTRSYARELATEIPAAERDDALQRLLRAYLYVAGRADRREHGGGDYAVLRSHAEPWALPDDLVDDLIADPIEWFQTEHANLVAAVRWAAQLGRHDLCGDLAVSSVTLFETRSYHQAWRETHEIALQAVREAGEGHGEAVLRYSLGGLALVEQRLADAQRDLDAALAWFEAAGDVHGRGLVLRHLASVDRVKGAYDAAQTRYLQALEDLRSVGDRVGEASVLRNIAQVHLERGQAEEAEILLRKSLAICVEVGTRRIEAQVRYRLGEALLARGKRDGAVAAFTESLRTAEHTNDTVGLAFARLGIGRVRLDEGDLSAAETILTDALAAARSGGSRLGGGQILLALAELALAGGDHAVARARLDGAEAIFTEIGAAVWRARVHEVRRRL